LTGKRGIVKLLQRSKGLTEGSAFLPTFFAQEGKTMPTINQLVRHGRERKKKRTRTLAFKWRLQLAQGDLPIRPSGRPDDAGRLLGRSDDDA
jgi:hypothetical protein